MLYSYDGRQYRYWLNKFSTEKLDGSGNVKIRGYFDMSSNNFTYISGLYVCDASGSSISGGNSLDISSNSVYFKNKGGTIPILLDVSGNVKIRGYLDMSSNQIKDVSGIFFCSGGGGIDLSCNSIKDVSSIKFSSGGGGIDLIV